MRLPFGANVVDGGVEFRVWAPKASRVEVDLFSGGRTEPRPLEPGGDGVFGGIVRGVGAGTRYRYRLDGKGSYPDPWSRAQPEGVHGPSEVVDPRAFRWTDAAWQGLDRDRLVIYELHVGTFTPAGTFEAIVGQLDALRRLGVTTLELMPIAAFPGRWNWGYDGVDLFAPSPTYGGPTGLRRLVDAAHRKGLGVLLDVVYNHFGPDGNYLRAYSDDYFTARHQTPWGDALNYDGPNSRHVRELVVQNAAYWIREYHLDGLRLDATHEIHDASPRHLLAEIAAAAHGAAPERRPVVIAEDDRREVRLIRPDEHGGYGLDAVWADDFHHAVHTLLTGENEGYYARYAGTSDQLARAIDEGFLRVGARTKQSGEPPSSLPTRERASAFVFCIQNHDQIGNRALGERLNHLVGPAEYAVASGLLLLVPETPLLFMGQEFAASAPFLYFTDHHPELGRLVTAGRRSEFAHFSAFADPARRDRIPDPQAESTFARSKLDVAERRAHAGVLRLYRELLALRRTDPVLSRADGATTKSVPLGDRAVLVRRGDPRDPLGARLIVANFGPGLDLAIEEIPAFRGSPEAGRRVLLSTAARRFGVGQGERASFRGSRLRVPEKTLVVLAELPPIPYAERLDHEGREMT